MRIGVKPGQIGLTTAELRRFWIEAEDAGFESVWTFDHLTGELCYEAVTLLAAMAVLTRRVRMGCLVLANGTRAIDTLAAQLATIDALSGGRLEVGLGVASDFARRDFEALGLPFRPWNERFATYRTVVDRLITLTSPGSPLGARPAQSPLPLILGGASDDVRRLAIERGLTWNHSTASAADFRALREGQPDPQAQVFLRDVRSVRETIAAFREAGATRLVFVLTPPYERNVMRRLAHEAL